MKTPYLILLTPVILQLTQLVPSATSVALDSVELAKGTEYGVISRTAMVRRLKGPNSIRSTGDTLDDELLMKKPGRRKKKDTTDKVGDIISDKGTFGSGNDYEATDYSGDTNLRAKVAKHSSKASKAEFTVQPSSHPSEVPSSQPSSQPSDFSFLLCRQVPERPEYGLEEFDPGYSQGQPIFSELTLAEAETSSADVLAVLSGVATAAGAAVSVVAPVASAVLGVVAGVLSVVGVFVGKGEIDPVDARIRFEFEKTNQEIANLSLEVGKGFDNVRRDLADNELDELMGYLQAIEFSYQEMITASLTNNTSEEIKKVYTDRYRAACSRPQFTPEDIFRQLYGFACGDLGADRECTATNGADTGTCAFGVKKRQYILDIYKDVSDGLQSRIEEFSSWLLKAMILAQFHYGACLPRDAATCIDPYIDPVRKLISDQQVKSVLEVAANVNRTIECIVETLFRDTLSDPDFYINNIPGNGECLQRNVTEAEKNECVANETFTVIEREFPDKSWAVGVYSFVNAATGDAFLNGDPRDRTKVNFEGQSLAEFGFISVQNVIGLQNRFFHLMYRKNDQVEKNFTLPNEEIFDSTLTGVGTTCKDEDIRSGRTSVIGQNFADVYQQCRIICFDDVRVKLMEGSFRLGIGELPGSLGKIRLYDTILSNEHGFLAIQDSIDIPRGIVSSDIFRVLQNDNAIDCAILNAGTTITLVV